MRTLSIVTTIIKQKFKSNHYDIFMCGIVGYIGQANAFPILIEGLKKLEYRGYDSAGVILQQR